MQTASGAAMLPAQQQLKQLQQGQDQQYADISHNQLQSYQRFTSCM